MLRSLFVGMTFGIDQMGRALDATHMSSCYCMGMQSRVPIPDTVLPSEKGQWGPETVPLPVLTLLPFAGETGSVSGVWETDSVSIWFVGEWLGIWFVGEWLGIWFVGEWLGIWFVGEWLGIWCVGD